MNIYGIIINIVLLAGEMVLATMFYGKTEFKRLVEINLKKAGILVTIVAILFMGWYCALDLLIHMAIAYRDSRS